jgi:pimeloyl-ACP methyl ester carboxylesterase
MKPTIILVHGAWHNGKGFAALQGELAALDINSITVELTSVGEAGESLGDMYSDAALLSKTIEGIDGDCVVLGHSYGGLVITEGSAGSSKVKKLIYLTAFMLDAGETLYAACGSVDPEWWNVAADKSRLTSNTPAEVFYNTCSSEIAEAAVKELRTQSLPSFNQPVTKVGWREIPSAYIICEQDQAIPIFAQEGMSGRAGEVVRINTDHSPFLSAPKELALLINSLI